MTLILNQGYMYMYRARVHGARICVRAQFGAFDACPSLHVQRFDFHLHTFRTYKLVKKRN